jgi:hypothetical protein
LTLLFQARLSSPATRSAVTPGGAAERSRKVDLSAGRENAPTEDVAEHDVILAREEHRAGEPLGVRATRRW